MITDSEAKPAETDMGGEMCECTLSLHANVQVPPPRLFLLFVIEHLEFSAEYVRERLNKWNTC